MHSSSSLGFRVKGQVTTQLHREPCISPRGSNVGLDCACMTHSCLDLVPLLPSAVGVAILGLNGTAILPLALVGHSDRVLNGSSCLSL